MIAGKTRVKYSCCTALSFLIVGLVWVGLQTSDAGTEPGDREPLSTNCGFNVVATVLMLQTTIDKESILEKLNTTHFSRSPTVSFAKIVDQLTNSGLSVIAVRTSSISDVISITPPGGSAILQVLQAGREHFAVVHHADNGAIFYIDHPDVPLRMELRRGEYAIPDQYNNSALIVTRQAASVNLNTGTTDLSRNEPNAVEQSTSKEGAMLILVETHDKDSLEVQASISVVDVVSDVLTAQLTVHNKSNVTWVIDKVKGSCGCFKSYDIPPVLHPRDSTEWKFSFSNRELRSQQNSTVIVALRSENGKERNVLVNVSNRSLGDPIASASIYPSIFSFGWKDVSWIQNRMFALTITVPVSSYSEPNVKLSNGLKFVKQSTETLMIGSDQFVKVSYCFSFVFGPGVYRDLITVSMPSAGMKSVQIPFEVSIR
jgi:hypothetical protein